MNRRFDSGYDPSQIRVVPSPEAEACDSGWWRTTWKIETLPQEVIGDLHLPPPSHELGDLSLIVGVVLAAPGHITVEVLSRHEKLIGEEIAYVSLVMQAIRALYQEIIVDGYTDHPILRVAG